MLICLIKLCERSDDKQVKYSRVWLRSIDRAVMDFPFLFIFGSNIYFFISDERNKNYLSRFYFYMLISGISH